MFDDERLREALKSACVWDVVQQLPGRLDAELGEHGAGLSEGQMQRIAIARALFSNRPVLLLDESTSALDEVTEIQLLKNLRKLNNNTIIIVTHRPEVLNFADKICEFDEGGKIRSYDAGNMENNRGSGLPPEVQPSG